MPRDGRLDDLLGLVRAARRYDLGTDYGFDMPRGPRGDFHRMQLSQWHVPRCLLQDDGPRLSFSMDVVQGSPHLGTHIDAFVHAQSAGRIFGGSRVGDVFDERGWREHGAETIAPVVRRGVLLDVARALGEDPLPDLFEIRPEHLERTLEAQGTELREGDAVLVRTGKFAADYHGDGKRFFASQPGVGRDAAAWLADRGMGLLGTDTTATEPAPFPDIDRTVHEELLVRRGIHLVEILDVEALAADRLDAFLFVCLPLKLTGATGSWVRPVAFGFPD